MTAPTFLDLAASIDRTLHRNIQYPSQNIVFADSPFSLTVEKDYVNADATLGNIIVNLPDATICKGMPFGVKKTDASANTVLVQSSVGGQTIDGGPSSTLSGQNAFLIAVSDGANYKLFSVSVAAGGGVPATRTINTTAPITGGGDLSADRTLAIADGGIANVKLANMADQTIKGNNAGAPGAPLDLTAAQATAILNAMVGDGGGGGTKGLAPAPAAGDAAANKFLKADGTWAVSSPTAVSSSSTPQTAAVGEVRLVSASGGNIVVNLPTAAGNTSKTITIKKTDQSANTVTVTGNGGELIDIANTYVLRFPMDAVTVISDGTQWWVI
jgi:hypothetical protein